MCTNKLKNIFILKPITKKPTPLLLDVVLCSKLTITCIVARASDRKKTLIYPHINHNFHKRTHTIAFGYSLLEIGRNLHCSTFIQRVGKENRQMGLWPLTHIFFALVFQHFMNFFDLLGINLQALCGKMSYEGDFCLTNLAFLFVKF